MRIKPLFDRVLVLPEQNELESGIVLPTSARQRQSKGKIVAVGDGESLEGAKTTLKVKVGDTVFYDKFAGAEVEIDDVTYLIMRQIDLIGVIDD